LGVHWGWLERAFGLALAPAMWLHSNLFIYSGPGIHPGLSSDIAAFILCTLQEQALQRGEELWACSVDFKQA
jgi:hypothetical protein